ncbi:ATP-binding protein [Arenibaculum pallidiluteum]|uniref:ATP-binding protein n=1 Tax=Arenibaculum pallidiluteum TaxID=2812559 RepID=UPI001A95A98C|nr:ATP-binding protein [Arenibaculum pallidiluteum]
MRYPAQLTVIATLAAAAAPALAVIPHRIAAATAVPQQPAAEVAVASDEAPPASPVSAVSSGPLGTLSPVPAVMGGEIAAAASVLTSITALKLGLAAGVGLVAAGLGRGWNRGLRRIAETAGTRMGRWVRGDFGVRVRKGASAGVVGRFGGRLWTAAAGLLRDRERDRLAALTAEHRLAAVLAGVDEAVLGIDRSWNVTFLNARALDLAGCGDAVGRPLWDVLPEMAAPALAAPLCKAMRGGFPGEHNVRLGPSGRRGTMRAVPSGEGFVLCLGGVANPGAVDEPVVTREIGSVRAEAGLRNSFLAGAAHELRQPVQSLMLFGGILEDRLTGHDAAPVAAALNRSLRTVGALIDDFLDVCRIDAAAEPRSVPVPLGPILERLDAEYRPYAEAHGLRLSVAPTHAIVRSDATLLERMLRNLVEGALRQASAGGRVVVGLRRAGGDYRLEVLDDGPGLPEERREALAAALASTLTDGPGPGSAGEGLGLGLAVVRHLAGLLGHPLGLRPVRGGRGTAFAIELPAADAVAPSPAPEAEAVAQRLAEPAAGTGSVAAGAAGLALVIEDEAVIREGLRRVLENWGWNVVEAGSAAEALGLVSGRKPDLILADYQLGGGARGTDAIRKVEAACGAPVPAIVLTGDTAPEREREIRAGGHALMHKPLSAAALRRLIDTLAPERHALAAGAR